MGENNHKSTKPVWKRSDLISEFAAKVKLPPNEIDKALRIFESCIIEALTEGKQVDLGGFGAFLTSERLSRTSRNPLSGELIHIPEQTIPRFRPASNLKQALNNLGKNIHPDAEKIISQEESYTEPDDFDPANLQDAREWTASSIKRRRGQPQLRQALLKAYRNRCAVTECDVIDALEAAHIIQYLGSHTNCVTNGLLLRADIHTLFDLHLISVHSVPMTVIISPRLDNTSYGYLANKKLHLPDNIYLWPHKEALDKHREQAGF